MILLVIFAVILLTFFIFRAKRKMPVEDKDAWEFSFREEAIAPIKIECTIEFDYKDSKGQKTHRKVDVREFGNIGYGNGIMGHCHQRNATRTFRVDRMTNCTEPSTGVRIDDISLFLKNQYEKSPQSSCDQFMKGNQDWLKIMLYIAKADGQNRKEEKSIIASSVRKISGDDRITDETVSEMMRFIGTPSLRAFQMAVNRIFKNDTVKEFEIIETAEKIVSTQKTMSATEKECLDYLKKKAGTAAGQ